eukprot:7383945-Prymnesium_polylepis.2
MERHRLHTLHCTALHARTCARRRPAVWAKRAAAAQRRPCTQLRSRSTAAAGGRRGAALSRPVPAGLRAEECGLRGLCRGPGVPE